MSKYKGPTRDKVAKTESARLATMRDAGISHVGILASPNPGEFCEECAAIMFTRDNVGFCRVCQRAIARIIDMYAK